MILTAKDLAWFRLANSNPPHGFYDFKARFLKRFGTPDGWDKQEIERTCHACDGSGQFLKDVECNRCNGSGIYDTREHWLRRNSTLRLKVKGYVKPGMSL